MLQTAPTLRRRTSFGSKKKEPKYVCQSEAKTSHSHSHVCDLRFPPKLHTSQIKDCRLDLLCKNDSAGVCDSSKLRACNDTSVTEMHRVPRVHTFTLEDSVILVYGQHLPAFWDNKLLFLPSVRSS